MSKKVNKYLYGWALYVNYGGGWEHELFEESRKEIKDRIREYKENCPQWPIKVSQRRELNPSWEKLQNVSEAN